MPRLAEEEKIARLGWLVLRRGRQFRVRATSFFSNNSSLPSCQEHMPNAENGKALQISIPWSLILLPYQSEMISVPWFHNFSRINGSTVTADISAGSRIFRRLLRSMTSHVSGILLPSSDRPNKPSDISLSRSSYKCT